MSGLALIRERQTVECSMCFEPAVWTHRHGCGFPVYACERHRLRLDIANSPRTPGFLTCSGCGFHADQPMPWRQL